MSEIEEEIRRQVLAERRQAASPDFVLPDVEPAPQSPAPPPSETAPSRLHHWQSQGGIIGGIATVALLLAKVGGPLLKAAPFLPKLFVTFGSMFLSMWAWGLVYGWMLGVGVVLLIFIHECGHAFAAHMRGLPVNGMVFLPFMGAFVATKGGRNVVEDAYIGIMGPVFGALSSVACYAAFVATGQPFWLALAQWGFFINLINLAPTAPLDGGWIVPVFSPKLLALGIVLLFVVMPNNPMIWILALLSVPRIIAGWHAKPSEQPYFRATAADRWRYGLGYAALVGFLANSYLSSNRILADYDPLEQGPGRTRIDVAAPSTTMQ